MITGKEKKILEGILSDMEKAQKYLLKEEILIGRKNVYPYGTSFVNKEGVGFDPYTKEVGSDLSYLFNAVSALRYFLNPPVKKEEGGIRG